MGFFFSKSAHSSNNSNLVIFLENEVIVGCNSYFTVAKSHTETDTSRLYVGVRNHLHHISFFRIPNAVQIRRRPD